MIPLPKTGGMDLVVRDLMSRPNRPTVVAGPEHHASAFLAACRMSGLSVPGDFSVLSITNSDSERRAERQNMASTLIDSTIIGRRAGEIMLAWMAGEPPDAVNDVAITRWTPRGTVGPPAP
jgi:DNA-binding LacI/PurR family transcriptional regulator